MAYKLGPVKSHVAKAANEIGPRYGIKTVWGFGAGSVPNSDHPLGLALDFMINNIANGRAVGDALAEYLIANANALGIKYIIWYRREWSPDKGWHRYTGFNPHTDHVHVSFNSKPGTGATTDGGAVGASNPLVPDSVEQLVRVFNDIGNGMKWITNADNWTRIGLFAGGFALVWIAVIGLPSGKVVTKAVGEVIK